MEKPRIVAFLEPGALLALARETTVANSLAAVGGVSLCWMMGRGAGRKEEGRKRERGNRKDRSKRKAYPKADYQPTPTTHHAQHRYTAPHYPTAGS